MTTTRRSQAARANGAKSQGPKTEEGRTRSSRNALKHGLTALKFVLPNVEDRDEFYHLREAYLERFQPADQVELRLVETLILCDWRLRRLTIIETNILSNEMTRQGPNPDPHITEMDPEDLLAWTFNNLANNHNSLSLLSRYQGQIDRTYHRSLKQLTNLQATRPGPNPDQPAPDRPAPQCGAGPRPAEGSQPASPNPAEIPQPNEPSDQQPKPPQHLPPPPTDPDAAPEGVLS